VQVFQISQTPAQDVTEQLTLTGTVRAVRQAKLSALTSGLVAKVLVDAGDQVKAGQPLLQLDDALSERQLQQAAAMVEVATAEAEEQQRRLAEATRLSQQQMFPATEVAQRQAAARKAVAELTLAKAKHAEQQVLWRQHQIVAPFAGVIKARYTESGEWLQPGQMVLELVEPTQLWLEVQVPQEKFSQIASSARIDIKTDMQPDLVLSAQIDALVPISDTNARSFLLRLAFTDPQTQVLAGTSATATLHLPPKHQGSLVPTDALVRHPDGGVSVFVVKNNQALRHIVQVGRSSAAGVEITPALPPATQVVIRGNEQLQHEQQVVLHTKNSASTPTVQGGI
jgi:RND family efflux transporter MFP subunit